MDFTDTQQTILADAWLLTRDGQGRALRRSAWQGQVLEDWAVPDAERLCDAGWLERRTVDNTDDVAFFWTPQAETALDMNALNQSVEGRQN